MKKGNSGVPRHIGAVGGLVSDEDYRILMAAHMLLTVNGRLWLM